MFTQLKDMKIIGMAAAVSSKWVSIQQVSDEPEAVLKKFTKNTGVEGRYAAGIKQTTSDFCFAAAEKILTNKDINREEIGVLVFVTQTADYGIPATACVLQHRLGLPKDCLAFDVNLGCSGFTYGVTIAGSLLNATDARYALLLCGDTSAKEKSAKEKIKDISLCCFALWGLGNCNLDRKDARS